jgi:hypothetical protein
VPVPEDFVAAVRAVESAIGRPVWLCIQGLSDDDNESISEELVEAFIANETDLPGQPIGLIIHSTGGHARAAYRLAALLQKRCKVFAAIIPRMAKSAATMLALGADKIFLADGGELGPIDVQIRDPEREEQTSALDDTQAMEALHNAALEMADTFLILMKRRTGKKFQTLMPPVFHFVADVMKPLFESIDTFRYVQMSRSLKAGEEYVFRLLLTPRVAQEDRYSENEAKKIAHSLATDYPEHTFFISRDEAKKIGLRMPDIGPELALALKRLYPYLAGFPTGQPGIAAIGYLKEMPATGGQP